MQLKSKTLDSYKKNAEVAVIAAFCVKTRVIGKDGKIPWMIKEDLSHFKELTSGKGHAVIFGRKTFESIGHALPNRLNIILSKNPDFKAQNAFVVKSLKEALDLAEKQKCKKIFICGGGKIYEEGIKIAEKIFATEISGNFEGDTFFPYISSDDFTECQRIKYSNTNYSWDFVTYQRNKS